MRGGRFICLWLAGFAAAGGLYRAAAFWIGMTLIAQGARWANP